MTLKKNKGNFKDIITSKLKGSDDDNEVVSSKKIAENQAKSVAKKQVKTQKKENSSEDDENLLSDLRVISTSKELSRSVFECYAHIPADRQITKQTDVGSRVIVAKYPAFYKIYFMEYIDAGQPHFPHGGIKVYNATYEQSQYFYYECVAIHPTKHDKYRVKNIDE